MVFTVNLDCNGEVATKLGAVASGCIFVDLITVYGSYEPPNIVVAYGYHYFVVLNLFQGSVRWISYWSENSTENSEVIAGRLAKTVPIILSTQ